jgi:hypothetical protein
MPASAPRPPQCVRAGWLAVAHELQYKLHPHSLRCHVCVLIVSMRCAHMQVEVCSPAAIVIAAVAMIPRACATRAQASATGTPVSASTRRRPVTLANPCEIHGTCNEDTGKCEYKQKICDSANPCEIDGTCNQYTGECEYKEKTCDSGNLCEIDGKCNKYTGECEYEKVPLLPPALFICLWPVLPLRSGLRPFARHLQWQKGMPSCLVRPKASLLTPGSRAEGGQVRGQSATSTATASPRLESASTTRCGPTSSPCSLASCKLRAWHRPCIRSPVGAAWCARPAPLFCQAPLHLLRLGGDAAMRPCCLDNPAVACTPLAARSASASLLPSRSAGNVHMMLML